MRVITRITGEAYKDQGSGTTWDTDSAVERQTGGA